MKKLEEDAKKQQALGTQPLPMDRDEAEENFEQGLAALYPNDPKIQDALRKDRKERLGG